MTPAEREAIAGRYESRIVRGYVSGKLKHDPVYDAVLARLDPSPRPMLDLGCGVGILPLCLEARGLGREVIGVDLDARKIEQARRAIPDSMNVRFHQQDVRVAVEGFRGDVMMLDVLHYFSDYDQRLLLNQAAVYAAEGMIVIRDCLRDNSWRYRLTVLQESFSGAIRWLQAQMLNFPTRIMISETLCGHGFVEEVIPLWGRTPFNNYLMVYRRPVRN